ncbi:hypothetical protein [Zobellia nedashkovskayae]|uniref:hypothetical protein n=1 Tax=Zobellia nedashkovskayae TaxID=2779510 RepID=UPI001889E894|nr:hypothetical protein [Zobellia nedashkovskayae]
MIRKIGFAIICLFATGMYAQDGSVSPYSYFGLGELRSGSTAENQMMGGIGMYADSIHVNLKNPAAYGGLGIQGRDDFGITTYTAGLSYKQTNLKSYTESQTTAVTNLDYLSIGLSIKKGLGIGFGIIPYSSVGYNFEDLVGTEGSQEINQYSGDGGVNKVYMSVGYEFAKDFSIGVTANYNFGRIETLKVQSNEGILLGSKDERVSRINGVDFNYALSYSPAIDDTHTLVTSVRINTQANLTARNTQRIGSFIGSPTQERFVNEVDLAAQGREDTGITIPTTTTLGIGYGKDMQWFLGVEYSFQKLTDFSNDFLEIDNLVYKDASTLALGGFYTPERNSFGSYFKRVTYRAGVRLEKTGMYVNEKDINNFGITFGLGLPLGNNLSNLNLGFEVGKKGTTAADLIEESYFKVNLGLSLSDQWFRKRKIN